jgi:phosphoglycolate phosphatase
MRTAVLFDLDGTLVDSLGDIAAALDAVLVELGHPTHTREAYRRFVGEGARELVRRALPAALDPREASRQLDDALARYKARYRAHLVDETRPYEGIVELIAALRARGALLAVVTNKPHDAALEVVERLFEPGTFEVVLGQKDGVPHKPDPSGPLSILRALAVAPAHALFVGDSETDVRTAKNAGVRAVAVTWGLRDRHDLEASGPDHLVDHPREILALLEA